MIQLGDIGDVVLATTTFRALKESYPSARLSVLVRKGYGSLLEADPRLHETIEVTKSAGKIAEIGRENIRLVRRLRRANYDLVVDLRTGDRGAILAFFTGAPVRVSLYGSDKSFWRNRIFTRLVFDPKPAPPPVHPGADQSLRLVRAIGVDTEDTAPRLCISRAAAGRVRELLAAENIGENDRWVTINPFSRWKYKEWGYGKWVEVIDWLWERRGFLSVLVGSREEAESAADIVGKCSGRARSLAGKTTLGELAALLCLGSLHLGVDSAAPHIAFAVGTPSVTIFGPSDWRSWTVPDDTHRIVTPDNPCVPCHRKGCDGTERSICLEELGAEKVKNAISEVIAAIGAG
ncbi:MAG: glycosyltransferase family 9 protein [Deltaproteobacteria bacterium]|nr:glycosyltransferase family 9 protein [Deltaproteobacteria bacterium]